MPPQPRHRSHPPPADRAPGDIRARLAGLGAIAFAGRRRAAEHRPRRVGTRRTAPPPRRCSPTTPTTAASRSSSSPRSWSAAPASPTFLGGAMRRLAAGSRPGWAITGYVGGVGIMALFAVVVGCRAGACRSSPPATSPTSAPSTRCGRCTTASSPCCTCRSASPSFGLARAGVAAGITPRVFERLAPVGSGLLAVACAAGPAIAAGDAMAFFGLGGIGFLIWLAFLVTTGLRLVGARRRVRGMTHDTRQTHRRSPPHSSSTWSRRGTRADGPAFGAAFAADADFVDIRGTHHGASPPSAAVTRRSSTRSTPGAPSATTSTPPGGRTRVHPRSRRRDAGCAERPDAGDEPLPDHRGDHRTGRSLGGHRVPQHPRGERRLSGDGTQARLAKASRSAAALAALASSR